MDFLELASHKRYSIRKFSPKVVEKEKIEKICRAAQVAPTAANFQPQRILVLSEKESLEKLKECTPYHFEAPLAFVICYEKESAWVRKYDGQNSGEVDASIVTTHMMLEVSALGLGSTWVMSFDPARLVELFEIPKQLVPVAILPVGYPAEGTKPSRLHEDREPLENTVYWDRFLNWQPMKKQKD